MMNVHEEATFLSALFDAQEEYIIWTKPVWSSAEKPEIIDFELIYGNLAAAVYTRTSKDKLLGVRLFTNPALDEERRKIIFDQMLRVYTTGEPVQTTYYNPVLNSHLYVYRKKLWDGVLSVTAEYSKEINALQEKERSSAFADSILDASINAVFACEAIREQDNRIIDLRIIRVNPALTHRLAMNGQEAEGKNYLSLFPSSKENGIFNLIVRVIETGVPLRKEIYYTGERLNGWFDISINKLGDGAVVNFADITESKQSLLEKEHQRTLVDNILKHSTNGISVLEVIRDENGRVADGVTLLANDAAIRYTGIGKEIIRTRKISEIAPDILTGPLFQMALVTLQSGEPFTTQYYVERFDKWLELSVSKMDDDHLINVFTDITVTKKAQLEVEQSARILKELINTSQSGMSLYRPVKDERGWVTDFRFDITNPTFVSYIGQKAETVIGDLVSKWYPTYKENGMFELCVQTYISGKTYRGEFHYRGHGVDAWIDIMSTKLGDGILITMNDLTGSKQLHRQLEKTIEELKRSNTSLEEFSYAASHDLQEPLRKISTFSDRLRRSLHAQLSDDQVQMFKRMEAATHRMRMLIDDLLDYSQANQQTGVQEPIDLNEKIGKVLKDLEIAIEEKEAKISVDHLPVIQGHRRQLQQLFQNLISNALKYSKKNVAPVIHIRCVVVKGSNINTEVSRQNMDRSFYKIEVSDNGIGFEQEYAGRIFQMFHRLHGKSEYSGTGVGLTIAKKVVDNHNGYITATGNPGIGSCFDVYLPVS